MNKKVLSLFFGLAVLAASCKKDNTAPDAVNPDQTSLAVPANFAWQTVKDVNLSIGITDSRFKDKMHIVEVYFADPSTGAQPITTGTATLVTPFNTRISIPTSINQVYLVKTSPDGVNVTEKMALISGKLSYSLSSASMNNKLSSTAVVNPISEPSCGTETSDTNININSSSDVICFNATDNVTINVNANNGGTLKLSAPGKTITLGNFNHTKLKLFVKTGTTVKWSNDLNISEGETFVNDGIMSGGKINLAGVLTNKKEVSATEFTVNSKGALNNHCTLKVSGMFINNQLVSNYKLITAGSTIVNTTGVVNMYDGAMFLTDTFSTMDGIINGKGKTSLFRTLKTTASPVYDNTSGRFTGTLQYCGDKQLEDNQNSVKHFFDGAVQSCDVFIATDGCNTIGNGTDPITKPDTDGDGVLDEKDKYPKDPTKAFNNYSCNYHDGGSTLAFEDNWPAEGDYDMNDVVLTYKHLAVTNAKNIVVRVEGEYNLLASGGEFKNGVGVMFNLPKGNARNFVSSNNIGLEAGQDSVVVVLFNDTRASQKFWNTIPGEATSAAVKTSFSFDVANGPSIQAVGIGGYNPFIWNNSSESGRGHETHLRGKNPTKLANKALFNTRDDASAAGKNYSTAENHPWALELPIANFKYPSERSNIKDAYLKYADWATSGGTNSVDWYSNTESGYRDSGKIY